MPENRNQNESNQNIVPSSGTKSQARNKQREVINVVEELDLIIENYQKSSRDFYFENYKDERVIEEELSKKMREIYREAHEEEKKEWDKINSDTSLTSLFFRKMAEPTVLMHKAMVRVVVQETAKPRNQLLNDSTKRTEQLRELIKGLRNNIICLANEHQNELAEKDAEIKSKNNKIKELENQVTNLNQKLPTIQQEKQNNLDLFCEISTRRNFSSVIIKQLSVEEKTAISQWDKIKTAIEKETNSNRLANENYWDKQIQNLDNDKLPADKKSITLQTRRRNYYNQLVKAANQTTQLVAQIQIPPKQKN